MLLTNRLFEREPPSREAKSIYIFCEGVKREYQYFKYFVEMDSRINIEIYELNPYEDNSLLGLLDIAQKSILDSKENPRPKYQFQENDEVWIIIDTHKDKLDSRKPQIEQVKNYCIQQENWFVLISNPCFEVWLYFHLFSKYAEFEGYETCTNWKDFLNKSIPGGFDLRKYPIYIQQAAVNAKANFHSENDLPTIGCTEIFRLAESMIPLIRKKLNKAIAKIEENTQ